MIRLWLLLSLAAGALPARATAAEQEFPIVLEPLLFRRHPPMGTDAGARNLSSLVRVSPWFGDALRGHFAVAPEHELYARVATGLIDLGIVLEATWLQHEGFGHAVACRDLRLECLYTVAFPPPFGSLEANFTYFGTQELQPYLGVHFYSSGRRAEQTLHDELLRHAVASGALPRTTALSFSLQAARIGFELLGSGPTSDRARYLAALPLANPEVEWRAYTRNIGWVTALARIADPVLWFSMYAYFVEWLARGKQVSFPDLLPGPLRGVIRPRVTEGSRGFELGADTMFLVGDDLVEAGFLLPTKAGIVTFHAWLDAPIASPHRALELRGRLAFWLDQQPGGGIGGGIELDATAWLSSQFGLHTRLGAKTGGPWSGRPYAMAAYVQIGAVLR